MTNKQDEFIRATITMPIALFVCIGILVYCEFHSTKETTPQTQKIYSRVICVASVLYVAVMCAEMNIRFYLYPTKEWTPSLPLLITMFAVGVLQRFVSTYSFVIQVCNAFESTSFALPWWTERFTFMFLLCAGIVTCVVGIVHEITWLFFYSVVDFFYRFFLMIQFSRKLHAVCL